MIAYLTLLATSICGLAGTSAVLAIAVCAGVLAVISTLDHLSEYRRAVSIGGWRVTLFCFWHSLFNATIAAAAAYGLGFVMKALSL